MGKLLVELSPGATTAGLSFTGQVIAAADAGRPDLVGSDEHGVRLVIEAKFDAELTPAQLGDAYVNRLSAGHPGALLFLVPQDRLAAIWPRLLSGPGRLPQPAIDLVAADQQFLVHPLGDGRVIAAISWGRLLGMLRHAMEAENEDHNLTDLAQIEGLVRWRGKVGWTPLLPGDMPDRAGRQLEAVVDSVLRVAALVSAVKTKNGSGDGGPGRYIGTEAGWSIWVGVWFRWWARYGKTPAWAQVRASTGYPVDLLAATLNTQSTNVIPRAEESDVLVPLFIPVGVEQGSVEASLANQLEVIKNALDALGAPPANNLGAPLEDPVAAGDPEGDAT